MYEREFDVALKAVEGAGRFLLDEYVRFQAIPNAPADITTDADRQAQELILQTLCAAFPDDGYCAEEQTATIAGKAPDRTRVWVIDPIDGTRGFARKNGEFSVMVGLVDRGEVALGLVLQPAAARLTYAIRGQGCWRRDNAAAPVACRVGTVRDLPSATLVQSRSKDPAKPSRAVRSLQPGRIVETYSAGIKLALVARGEVDVYLNSYEAFHDWDICAGQILVTEAGGMVTGLGGQVLRYCTPGAWQRDGLLASNGLVHQEALKMWNDRSASAV
jgi:3'(2'), 5'-bisphosphate nucleotidase